MTNQTTNTPTKTSSSPALLLGLLGLGISFLVVCFGVVLPFLVPPILKWQPYQMLFQPIWWTQDKVGPRWLTALITEPLLQRPLRDGLWLFLTPVMLGALVGPWLAIVGLFSHVKKEAKETWATLGQAFGCQLLLLSVGWMVWQGVQIYQGGTSVLQKGVLPFLTTFSSLVWAPVLLAVGIVFLNRGPLRDLLGVLLASSGYQAAIVCSAQLYVALIVSKAFPMQFRPPSKEIIALSWNVLLYASPAFLVLGTLLMSRTLRLRFHLLVTAPIWLPLFVVFFFWSLVIHTTLYFIEDLTGWTWQPSLPVRLLLLSWLSLPLFPLLLTIDFGLSLMRFLGQTLLDHFFPPDQPLSGVEGSSFPQSWVLGTGAVLLFTIPLWLLPAFLYWGVRMFVYESLLLPLLGRPQVSHTPHHTSTAPGSSSKS